MKVQRETMLKWLELVGTDAATDAGEEVPDFATMGNVQLAEAFTGYVSELYDPGMNTRTVVEELWDEGSKAEQGQLARAMRAVHDEKEIEVG